jgi:biotin-(acetyl-CoA carboxylase) ligase
MGAEGLPEELSATATSLSSWGVSGLPEERAIGDVLAELEPRVDAFLGGVERIVSEFLRYDALAGRRVRVGNQEGVCAGINRSGSLLLKDENGVVSEVVAGHVEVLSD